MKLPVAGTVGLEPTTSCLTGTRSAIELCSHNEVYQVSLPIFYCSTQSTNYQIYFKSLLVVTWSSSRVIFFSCLLNRGIVIHFVQYGIRTHMTPVSDAPVCTHIYYLMLDSLICFTSRLSPLSL